MEMASNKTLDPVSSIEQCTYQTLQLFPLHPTGILEKSESLPTCASREAECDEESTRDEEDCEILPFFNFFGENMS